MKALQICMSLMLGLLLKVASAQVSDISPKRPGLQPDRIVLNVTEDLSTSVAVTWRTSTSIANGEAQIVLADPHPASVNHAVSLSARTEVLEFGELEAHYHSVVFTNLLPNTRYAYRVGSEDYWSEWFHFTTTGTSQDKLSLIYFGDVQTNILSLWSRVARQAYRHAPEAKLALYAGDLVNRANRDVEWGQWFDAGGFIHSEIPVMPTPGNHDHGTTERGENLISEFWKPQFTLPENGPAGLEESCYYIDVQGVRLISLNTQRYDLSEVDRRSQREWLEQVLANNPNKWTCILIHHPVYSTKRNRDNKMMRADLKPLIDRFGVDLVLQGHDHTYARGMENVPMEDGKAPGTMYVVSVSGPKMSEVLRADWMDRTAGHTQLYHIIDIDNNILRFSAYTATGELYDQFELHKSAGSTNRLVNKVSLDTPEKH